MDFGKVYGLNACLMYAKFRKEKIVRAFFSKKVAPQFSELAKFLAQKKKVYRQVEQDELEKIAQTLHHEGACFIVVKEKPVTYKDWIKTTKEARIVVLENIGNPHNLGAIMRTCAHFGIQTLALQESKIAHSGAALRTAEGGAEFVRIIEFQNIFDLVNDLKKAGFTILTTSSHEGKNLFDFKFPEKFALLFGEEGGGLSKNTLEQGSSCLKIPGTQNVESLNVSSAISVILSEMYRQSHF